MIKSIFTAALIFSLMASMCSVNAYARNTWNALEQTNSVEARAYAADMDTETFKFFSSVVEAESDRKKGSIEGRVMIAIVILNRVESKKFPNTVTKVLRQRGQFSVVRSGAHKRVGRTELSDRAVVEAVRRKKAGSAPNVLYFRAGHYFRGHKRYGKVGDNYFSY